MGAAASGGGKAPKDRESAVLSKPHAPTVSKDEAELATFAAGCFWGVELAFQRIPGVLSTQVGYTGGKTKSPSYEAVCSGATGHAEAVELRFDPTVVTYDELLGVLWERHDPTTLNRQGNDRGTQYRSAIFTHTDQQATDAFASKAKEEERIGQKIVTEIVPASVFYPAEAYHQQYLSKGGQCSRKGDRSGIRCYG